MTRKRVVTGVDAQGRSVIVTDGPWPGQWDRGENDYYDDLWIFSEIPARLDIAETTSTAPFRIPADNEVIVRTMTLQPEAALASLTDAEREARRHRIDFSELEWVPEHAGMHRTLTVDVGLVLAGEVELELDSGQVAHLKPGDSVIQRGTFHAWRVTSDVPCVMAFVLVRAAGSATTVAMP